LSVKDPVEEEDLLFVGIIMNEFARLLPGYKKLSEGQETSSLSECEISDSEKELFDVVSLLVDNNHEQHVCFSLPIIFLFFVFSIESS
jgi:hypothetical protein